MLNSLVVLALHLSVVHGVNENPPSTPHKVALYETAESSPNVILPSPPKTEFPLASYLADIPERVWPHGSPMADLSAGTTALCGPQRMLKVYVC